MQKSKWNMIRKNQKFDNFQNGTTLIEMILYIAIVAVLLTGVGMTSMNALDAKTKTRAVSDVFAAATGVFATLERVIGTSTAIWAPLPGVSADTLILLSGIPATTTRMTNEDGTLFFVQGILPIALTGSEVHVDLLRFEGIGVGATTTAVRTTVALSASTTGIWRSFQYKETFVTTFVLSNER